VAHSYNPSYLEGRDQEDCGSKSAQANSLLLDPILEKTIPKIGLVEWLKVKALSSTPVLQKKKKEKYSLDNLWTRMSVCSWQGPKLGVNLVSWLSYP
jgi:hypothetical protein